MPNLPLGKSKTFTIFWLDGDKDVLRGDDDGTIQEALSEVGFDEEIQQGIDFCIAGVSNDYMFSTSTRKWVRRPFRNENSAMACLNGLTNHGEFS